MTGSVTLAAVHFGTQCGGAVAGPVMVAARNSIHLSMATGPQQDRHTTHAKAQPPLTGLARTMGKDG
jgi:hypothetical protein